LEASHTIVELDRIEPGTPSVYTLTPVSPLASPGALTNAPVSSAVDWVSSEVASQSMLLGGGLATLPAHSSIWTVANCGKPEPFTDKTCSSVRSDVGVTVAAGTAPRAG